MSNKKELLKSFIKWLKKGNDLTYVKGTLSDDEQIIESAKLHWINYIVTAILGFVALVMFFELLQNLYEAYNYFFSYYGHHNTIIYFLYVIGGKLFLIFIFIINYLSLRTTEYVVTNKRVVSRRGVISIKTQELKNAKIESVEIRQSILGRILGYATICFSGTGTSKVKFFRISNPWDIKARIEKIIGD